MLPVWVTVLDLVVFDCYSLVGLVVLVLDVLVIDLLFCWFGVTFVVLLAWFLGGLLVFVFGYWFLGLIAGCLICVVGWFGGGYELLVCDVLQCYFGFRTVGYWALRLECVNSVG